MYRFEAIRELGRKIPLEARGGLVIGAIACALLIGMYQYGPYINAGLDRIIPPAPTPTPLPSPTPRPFHAVMHREGYDVDLLKTGQVRVVIDGTGEEALQREFDATSDIARECPPGAKIDVISPATDSDRRTIYLSVPLENCSRAFRQSLGLER